MHPVRSISPPFALFSAWDTASPTVASQITIERFLRFFACVYGPTLFVWFFYFRGSREDSAKYKLGVTLLCTAYCTLAIGMELLNKTLISAVEAPAIITAFQMLVAVICLAGISFKDLLRTSRKQVMTWLVIPVLFAASLVTSFSSQEYLSLSCLMIFRNLAPLLALPFEHFFIPPESRPGVSIAVVVSVIVMAAGAMLYCSGTQDVSRLGLFFTVVHMLLALVTSITSRRLLLVECNRVPLTVCVLVNNAIGLFPVLVCASFEDEWRLLRGGGSAKLFNNEIIIGLCASGILGVGIGYCGVACQKSISATSFLVMENVNRILVATLGIIFFRDPLKTPQAAVGLFCSFAGSFLYGWAQNNYKGVPETQRLLQGAWHPAASRSRQGSLATSDRSRQGSLAQSDRSSFSSTTGHSV